MILKEYTMTSANAYQFLKEAVKIAPVYMGLGNHEEYLLARDRQEIAKSGVKLLDNEDCVAVIKNMSLRIGGLSTEMDADWLNQFCRKDGYKTFRTRDICSRAGDVSKIYQRNLRRETCGVGRMFQYRVGSAYWKSLRSGNDPVETILNCLRREQVAGA